MQENLVIVESPAKAKTIEKFLGKDFIVKSSFGHIRDLAKKDLGINIGEGYKPVYEIPGDKKKVHLIQADNAVRQDILIRNEDELIHAMNHFELRGGGGTDFRPAFAYVDQLCAEKKFSNLRGLLYFTDGMGTYPAKRPAYDTAFLFLGERFDDANVPPWAMKVVLDEEEFTGAAARPQSTLADALAEEDDPYRELNNS